MQVDTAVLAGYAILLGVISMSFAVRRRMTGVEAGDRLRPRERQGGNG